MKLGAWVALFIVSFSSPAVAGRFDLTSTTLAGWHTDRGYGELFERLNVVTGTDAWSMAFRFDTATFVSEPNPFIEDRYTFERASVGWQGRSLEVIAGDSYVSIGRGLVLSLRKIDELGVDTTLRGAKLLVHEGIFSGILAAGISNIQNIDEATGRSVDDPYDLIGGLDARVTLFDRITVGVQGSAILFESSTGLVPKDKYEDRYFQIGPSISAPRIVDWFGFYLEGVAQVHDSVGYGLYGQATAYFGPATLLFEGKAYGDLAPIQPNLGLPEFDTVAYNNPPTVERVLQVIENPQRNIAGGRLRLDWSFSPSFLAYLNYGVFRDWEGYGDPNTFGVISAGTIHDPYAGFEARWNEARSWALFSAGYRPVLVGGAIARGDLHFELDGAQALGDRWSLTVHALHLERQKSESPILDQKFREGTVLVGVRFHPWIAVSGGYDYTTEPTQDQDHYFSGAAEWFITSSSSLRFFGGAQRGGLKCTSGVCRIFPPFEGVKLTGTVRF
jgi:hypothetical protein